MAQFILPFYKEFFLMIEKNEIFQWEAKKIIDEIVDKKIAASSIKQKVYRGINILVQCGYLTREINPKNKRTFLYTETMKSKKYREVKINEKMKILFNTKLTDVIEKIDSKNSELFFIEKIIDEYPFTKSMLENICTTESDNLRKLNVHKNVLSKLIDRLD